jgi:aminoglycoside phosphotransferase (APT) family kinase protein
MTPSLAVQVPTLPDLTTRITALFNRDPAHPARIEIVKREQNGYGSTFATEIVSLVRDGRQEKLFLKYENGRQERSDGHRRGIAHEVAVYEQVLEPLRMNAPKLYGGCADDSGPNSWIALEYIDGGIQLQEAWEPEAMPAAAAWIGKFHARAQRLLGANELPFLPRYDSQYVLRWPQAISRYDQECRFPWLREVFARLTAFVHLLCTDRTVIHGEYYPVNVVFHEGSTYPVDWQSAAAAAGEIDLAILTSGKWNAAIVAECEQAYCAARWPGGVPKSFPRTLAVARLYWLTRLIGEDPERLHLPAYERCLHEIRAADASLKSLE